MLLSRCLCLYHIFKTLNVFLGISAFFVLVHLPCLGVPSIAWPDEYLHYDSERVAKLLCLNTTPLLLSSAQIARIVQKNVSNYPVRLKFILCDRFCLQSKVRCVMLCEAHLFDSCLDSMHAWEPILSYTMNERNWTSF